MIPYRAVLLHLSRKLLILFGGKTYLGADIGLQQMFTIAISEHPDQRIVDFNESPVRCREKHSFLNVVKKFAIAPLGFATVSDVLEHVDGLEALVVCPMDARAGHKIRPVQNRENELVGRYIRGRATERTRMHGCVIPHRQQSAHLYADKFMRLHTDEISQRTVHPQNMI